MSQYYSLKPNPQAWAVLADKSNIHFANDAPNPEIVVRQFDAINKSQTGCTIQCLGLNEFTRGRVRLEFDMTVTCHSTTVKPIKFAFGTQPYVFGNDNSSFDSLCVNKLVSELKFFDGTLTQEDTDRKNPEYMNIVAMQLDQKIMNDEYGIHLLEDCDLTDWSAISEGCISAEDFLVVSDNAILPSGVDGLVERVPAWLLNKNKKYCKMQGKSAYVMNGTAVDPAKVKQIQPFGNWVPTDGTNIVYSGNAAGNNVTQSQKYTVSEYIISKQTSVPYSNASKEKVFNTRLGQLTIQMQYNQTYLKSMFKVPNQNGPMGVFVDNINIDNVRVYVETYKTFPFVNMPSGTSYVYYQPNAINDQTRLAVPLGSTTPVTAQFNSQNERYLPPYFIIYGAINACDNPISGFTCNSTDRMATISDVQFTIGGDMRNVLEGRTIADLQNDTAEILRDPKWLAYLNESAEAQCHWSIIGGLGTDAGGTISVAARSTGNASNSYPLRYKSYPFIILDMSKYNLGYTVGGRPLVPSVDYQRPINWNIIVNYLPPAIKRQYYNADGGQNTTAVNINCRVLYLTKWFVKISDGHIQPTECFFNISEFDKAFHSYVNSNPIPISENELMGGGWFSSLKNAVQSVMPIAKTILSVGRAATPFMPPSMQGAMNTVSSAAHTVGLGRKSRKSIAWE